MNLLSSNMANNMRRRRSLFYIIQKRFLTGVASPSPAASSPSLNSAASSSSSFTVQFLINSCGLSSKSVLSASHKLQIDEKSIQNAHHVLQFLKSHSFEDTHIAKLINKRPSVLRSRLHNNLKPKFDFLTENGFAGERLPQLIVSNPDILKRSLDSKIKPTFRLLSSFLHGNENVVVAMTRSSWLLSKGTAIKPAVDFLINEGMPVDRLQKLIFLFPRTLVYEHDRMVYALNYLKNLGIQPEDGVFVYAFNVMLSASESTRWKKIEVMRSVGWSEEEISRIFKRHPQILGYSEEKIRSAMDFLMNIVGLERQTILVYPYLLGYSIEKRICPRYNVIKVLKSKELLTKGDKRIVALLNITEMKFLNYVTRYAGEVPGLMEIYGSTATAKKTIP